MCYLHTRGHRVDTMLPIGYLVSSLEKWCISEEERIPADHPLRRIKPPADAVLSAMSVSFDAMYA